MVRKISLHIPNHFSFNETLSFLDRGYDECLYNLTDTTVSRKINLSDGIGIIKISQNEGALEVILEKWK